MSKNHFRYRYLEARFSNRLHAILLKEFMARQETEGLTREDVAERIGRPVDEVATLLACTGSMTLADVSDLLYAITGGELLLEVSEPLQFSDE